MADTQLSPEELAILGGSPEDTEQAAPEGATLAPQQDSPDQGVLGGLAQSLGLWSPPPAQDPAAAAEAVASKEAQRQDTKAAMTSGPLGAVNSVLGAPIDAIAGTAGGGAMKSVFETKDFLFGDTPPAQQSDFRYNIERDVQDDAAASMLNGVAAGFGQFSMGMLGVGKLMGAGSLLPFASKLKTSKAVYETGKAALTGAIAFDPHEARLSNLIQGTFLANPVNAWLSAKDDDGVLEGRMKNAFESIGMDATLYGTFRLAGLIYKVGKGLLPGGEKKVAELTQEFDDFQAAKLEEEANAAADRQAPQIDPTDGAGNADTVFEGYTSATGDSAPRADAPAPVGGDGSGSLDGQPQVPPQAEASVDAGLGGQPGTPQGRPELVAANSNPGGSTSITPEGGPASVNVKVRPDVLNPVDPNSNGFGVPKRPTPMQNPKPYVQFADENSKEVIAKSTMDVEAMDGHGGYSEAVNAGYKFGDTANTIPYHKFTTQTEVDNFIARAVDAGREDITDLAGGKVMTDARVDATVGRMVKLTGQDPGFILGKIQQSGRLAPQLVADMETGFVLAQKAWTDVTGLVHRYQMGDHTGYGTPEAHWADIQHRLSVAGSLYGAARSIMANSGRAMRRMRSEFMFDPGKYKDVDPGRLSTLIQQANGNPAAMKKVFDQRTIPQLIGDTMQFIRLAGLISGPATQIVNAVTSSYSALARPMERLIGSTMLAPFKSDALGQMGADIRQFHAMGGQLFDSFKQAGEVFLNNESTLAPHMNEAQKMDMAPGAQPLGQNFFRYRDITAAGNSGLNNLVYNLLSVAGGAASVPTRALGSVDEVIKQNVYRSYVQSRAAYRASQEAAEQGLKGKARSAYIKSETQTALDNAFDADGRGTDPVALKEAQTATFQQELGATGKKIQGLANANWMTKFIFPFTKTPMNIAKMGGRLTPVLGMVQRELRDDIMGHNGVEAQAQALGQQSMGALYTGIASYLVMNGMFTGGGPSDPKARRELTEQGWRPYAFVKTDADGKKTFYSMSRLDPVVMPMGMVADIIDHLHQTEWDGNDDSLSSIAQSAIAAVGIAAGKQFINKSYMLGASQFLNAAMDPEHKGEYWAEGSAQSIVPFSALSRQLDQDPYMKDVVGIWDNMRAVTPGMGADLPHRRDWLGEKVKSPGLTGSLGISSGKADPIDVEAQRIATTVGSGFGKPEPIQQGVDLRNIQLDDGRNAYEKLQDLAANPTNGGPGLREVLNDLVTSEGYKGLPEGTASQQQSKAAAIADIVRQYRTGAWNKLLGEEPKVQDAFKTELQKGADRFREVRGIDRVTPKDQNAMGHLLDAFGLDN